MTKLFGAVETVGHVSCSAAEAWRTVCFYEHVHTKPSWFLRTVLPVPQRTTGCYGHVGDESRCLYSDGGYLAKKITGLTEGECIDFDIIEQSIRYHKHIALRGGTIRVVAHTDRSCSVHMITRYRLHSPLVALIRRFVIATVSSMHRFVMRDMLSRLTATSIEFVRYSDSFPTAALRIKDEKMAIDSTTSLAIQ